MPSRFELASIVDNSRYGPGVDSAYFPNTPQWSWFWSSSPYANYTGYGWYVNFYYGFVDTYDKSYNGSVRLVRGRE